MVKSSFFRFRNVSKCYWLGCENATSPAELCCYQATDVVFCAALNSILFVVSC
ncbi:Uncharacterized protein ChrSV_1730 [Chromobacterium vaccinii]|nr:Uncharacterized protein ChrSW_1730 [Chromobacterium vaccinii]QND89188.1 Uncharacterized protein ChrSV_1730 [Chromobacterium vaccinii]